MAVWMERSIKGLGYERDFYVHIRRGRPVSVDTYINHAIETPISQSDTWAKIVSGQSDSLDQSDRPVLYALVRHLEARTPHYLAIGDELSEMASDPNSDIPFTEEERRMYALRRSDPGVARSMFNAMATARFDEREFDTALILVVRSPVRLRTSTAPAIEVPSPKHAAMDLPLPGIVPFKRMLTVDPYPLVSVVVGDFGGHFSHSMMHAKPAIGINCTFAGYFAKFPNVRHLVTNRDGLIGDMTRASYEVVSDTPAKIVFRRTNWLPIVKPD